uniref:Phosphatidic acid phosphatase type 2/haloperoxidase domain-containing protein n=1 Tax=Leersia perrieri TaxID=77586 RepID=A0A0D9X403_9ORYZ
MGEASVLAPPSASSAAADASSFSYLAMLGNCPLVAAVLAGAIAQFIKVLTTWYKENRWDAKQLVGSGGMPSSHSATVVGLAVAVGLQEGFGSSLFATAAIFASVVMYDAFGVRLHAGKQAEVLNQIVYELPSEHPLAETRPLRELLGHTPTQVFAGGVLGFAVATFTAMIAGLGNSG